MQEQKEEAVPWRIKFIEDAVGRRMLQRTVQNIREHNADSDPDEIQRLVDEAVSEVRSERQTSFVV